MGKRELVLLIPFVSLPISYQFIEQSRLFARASAEFKLNVWGRSRGTKYSRNYTLRDGLSPP